MTTGCLFSPRALCFSLSLYAALITPFSVSTLWFSAQSSPLEVSRPMCVNTRVEHLLFKQGTAVEGVTCCIGTQYSGFTLKHKQNTQAKDVLKALLTFFDLHPESGTTELKRYRSNMIPPPPNPVPIRYFFCKLDRIVGPFCGEALVKWAIIPVGESDDDFWQNAAAAPCQTIRAVAISSHGRTRTHSHARRLTPQTSCFSLSPQTREIE